MNYPCNMIQDLLPLYLDEVCSEESKKAVNQHLSECPECKAFYAAMCEADKVDADTHNADRERQKAASFQSVKKRIARKQLLAAVIAVVILAAAVFAAAGILKNKTEVVKYMDNISVSVINDDLVGRLQGSRISEVSIKRVTTAVNGQTKNYLFFCMSNTKWDALTTSSEVFSEYTLCSHDKNASQIDAVFYYTGEYDGIETMTGTELSEIFYNSILLWEK